MRKISARTNIDCDRLPHACCGLIHSTIFITLSIVVMAKFVDFVPCELLQVKGELLSKVTTHYGLENIFSFSSNRSPTCITLSSARSRVLIITILTSTEQNE